MPSRTETIVFGGGCFWCTEAVFKMFKGVVGTTSGYSGGETKNPTYEQVSTGTTGHAEVANAYARAVRPEGNVHAQRVMREVFEVVDRNWRGIGRIPRSGFALRAEFVDFDAARRFGVAGDAPPESTECISGLIMRGVKKPQECPAFGTRCTPEHPFGATMVSSEGACAAYYRYRRQPESFKS